MGESNDRPAGEPCELAVLMAIVGWLRMALQAMPTRAAMPVVTWESPPCPLGVKARR